MWILFKWRRHKYLKVTGFVNSRVSIDNWSFKFYYKYTTSLLLLFSAGTTARWMLSLETAFFTKQQLCDLITFYGLSMPLDTNQIKETISEKIYLLIDFCTRFIFHFPSHVDFPNSVIFRMKWRKKKFLGEILFPGNSLAIQLSVMRERWDISFSLPSQSFDKYSNIFPRMNYLQNKSETIVLLLIQFNVALNRPMLGLNKMSWTRTVGCIQHGMYQGDCTQL